MSSCVRFPSQAPKKSAEPIFGSVTERVNKQTDTDYVIRSSE